MEGSDCSSVPIRSKYRDTGSQVCDKYILLQSIDYPYLLRMKLFWILAFGLLLTGVWAQQDVVIDFGQRSIDRASDGNVNNVASSVAGAFTNGVQLYNSSGMSTGFNLQVNDAWHASTLNGTTQPDYTLGFPASATRDGFFGETIAFNGTLEPTGGFVIRNLDPTQYYSFVLFGSRMNVSDSRETQYTLSGTSMSTALLETANNTSNAVTILNLQPDANGEISLIATAGPNNTNPNGYYYLSALRFRESVIPIIQFDPLPSIELLYPVDDTTWEEGQSVTVRYDAPYLASIIASYTIDGGATYDLIGNYPGPQGEIPFTVPPHAGSNLQIRIASAAGVVQQSGTAHVIPDEGTTYKIGVLGSSTAAGTGPSSQDEVWSHRYGRFLYELDTRYDWVNLAQGGFVTYNILPTGTTIPAGLNETVDDARNITQALAQSVDGIIINLPSNDAANSYPVTDQLQNYNMILADAASAGVPVWVATPQPRNFGNDATKLNIQQQMVTETHNLAGDQAIDFWTGLGVTGGNGMLPVYDSGDGVHMNNEGHEVLYNRVILADVHGKVKTLVDATLQQDEVAAPSITLYPNPTSGFVRFDNASPGSLIRVYDAVGRLVSSSILSNSGSLNVDQLSTGTYSVVLEIQGNRTVIWFVKT